jgi:adenylate kinase family enzyme
MLELRLKSNAPKRPPRILVRGPPGSGCETQAKALAQVYGLVHLSAQDLLKKEMLTNLE